MNVFVYKHKSIFNKFKQFGLKESLKRMIPFCKRVGYLYGRIYFWTLYNRIIPLSRNKNILYAFMDLRTCPCDFSVIHFLVSVSSECDEKQFEGFHIVFVPGDLHGYKDEPFPFDKDTNQWRMQNIMISSTWLFPLCKGITVTKTRQEAQIIRNNLARHVFPKNYHVQLLNGQYVHDGPFIRCKQGHFYDRYNSGYPVHYITPQPKALYYVNKWVDSHTNGEKIITISLRSADYSLDTNSNLDAWIQFGSTLDQTIYHPVFVLDQETLFESIPEALQSFDIFHPAAMDSSIRAALYHVSYLNLMVINGPTLIATLNKKVRFISFKMQKDGDGGGTAAGIAWRESILQPLQKFVWEEDTYENIWKEFEVMCRMIELSENKDAKQSFQIEAENSSLKPPTEARI